VLTTIIQVDATPIPITQTCRARHVWIFKKYSRMSKPYHYLRVVKVKTLTLDGYWVLLNVGPLRGEWVPLFCIVLLP
jgi:hypothetical protein